MKNFRNITIGLALVMVLSIQALGQNDPENPCGGKNKKATQSTSNNGIVFSVDDPMNRNTVTFKSTAPLEDIVGTSNQVTGHLVFDPANPEKGGHGELSVPIKSLNTGIPLRNEHLASQDWLNAEKNPNITFKIAEVKNFKPVKTTADAQTFDVLAVGDISVNGVTKSISVPARITYLKESEITKQKAPGDLLAARTSFEITLADFGINGPKGMNLVGTKVGEKVQIELSVVASAASASMAGNPCGGKAVKKADNPCGPKAAENTCGPKKPENPCNPCGSK